MLQDLAACCLQLKEKDYRPACVAQNYGCAGIFPLLRRLAFCAGGSTGVPLNRGFGSVELDIELNVELNVWFAGEV